MSDDQQPELRWAPLEPKPDNRGRIWLIVGLSVAVLVIVGALLFFLLPRGESTSPDASPSPSPSASPSVSATPTESPSASPSASAQPEPEPEPTQTPVTSPPPPADPSVGVFRGEVEGWLDDALTGLGILSETSGADAMSVVDTLQNDAQRLSETTAPSSIDGNWRAGIADYAQRLTELRSAVDAGGSTSAAVQAARDAVTELRSTVGL